MCVFFVLGEGAEFAGEVPCAGQLQGFDRELRRLERFARAACAKDKRYQEVRRLWQHLWWVSHLAAVFEGKPAKMAVSWEPPFLLLLLLLLLFV